VGGAGGKKYRKNLCYRIFIAITHERENEADLDKKLTLTSHD
jgi:hypothetical protein